MAYNTIGPYTSGVWLIADAKGQNASVVDKSHLPNPSPNVQFYWLGANANDAKARLLTDAGKLGVKPDVNFDYATIEQAFQGKVVGVAQSPTGLKSWLEGLQYAAGHSFVTGPLTGVGDALVGVGAGEAATAGGAGLGAGAAAANATGALKAIAGGLTVGALFSNPSLWAGIGMALLGAFLVLFGIVKLSGADPKQLAKRMVP